MGITYDTGALIAADRAERRVWARHRALLALREVPTVPAPVLAQSWRGGGRQALLARLLAGCDLEALDDGQARAVGSLAARAVGSLAARAATTDIVNACVVEGAISAATSWSARTQTTCRPSPPPPAAASRSTDPKD